MSIRPILEPLPTKTVLECIDAFPGAIHSVTYAIYEDGCGLLLRKGHLSYQDFLSLKVHVIEQKAYHVFLLVNLGDRQELFGPKMEDMEGLACPLPPFTQLDAGGIPMAGHAFTQGECSNVDIELHALLAKLQVQLDHNGLTGGIDVPLLKNSSLYLRNVASVLYPFREGGSAALSEHDLYASNSDFHLFGASEGFEMLNEPVTLYIPENEQGTNPEDLSLCTYLEFQGRKDTAQDGVSGALTYRCHLGENAQDNYSITGGRSYRAVLSLSWNGMFLEGDWRVSRGSDWNDSRHLQFTGSHGESISECKVVKTRSTEIFTLFSSEADEGTGTSGAKDLNSYPYGWKLFVDGEPITGSHATLAEGLELSYSDGYTVGGKRCGKLIISAGVEADISQTHTISLYTADGQVQSQGLTLRVLDAPFQSRWNSAAPTLTGQKGRLFCVDPYSGEDAHDFLASTQDSDKIRLSAVEADGSVAVEVLKPGPARIYLTDIHGGRACEVNVETILPGYQAGSFSTLYPDGVGHASMTFPGLSISPEGAWESVGSHLDRALTRELFLPRLSQSEDPVAAESHLEDQSIDIRYWLSSFEGLPALSGNTVLAGHASFCFPAVPVMPGMETDITVYNPFRDIGCQETTHCMNDYTLYRRPLADGGWETSGGPVESTTYSTAVKRAIVASAQNLSCTAFFEHDGSEIVGICKGTPLGRSASAPESTWDCFYSMKDVSLARHGAGSVLIQLNVINPCDGSRVSCDIVRCYMRLHLFIWGKAWTMGNEYICAGFVYSHDEETALPSSTLSVSATDFASYPMGTQLCNSTDGWIEVWDYGMSPREEDIVTCRFYDGQSGSPDSHRLKALLGGISLPFWFDRDRLNTRYFMATDNQTLYYDPSCSAELYFNRQEERGLIVAHIAYSSSSGNRGWYWN